MRSTPEASTGSAFLTHAVDALATYRLTRLIVEDEITSPLRETIWDTYDPGETKIGYLITCPWCVSMWVGASVVAARRFAPSAWNAAAETLAFSTIAGILAQRV